MVKRGISKLEEVTVTNMKRALAQLLILKLCCEAPHQIKHCSAIIESRTNGIVKVTYPHTSFNILLEQGLIQRTDGMQPDDKNKRYYVATHKGRRAVKAQWLVVKEFMAGVCCMMEPQKEISAASAEESV